MKVHSYVGLGFPEIIHKRSLVLRFHKVGLRYNDKVEKDIRYHHQLIGKRRLDLIVDSIVYNQITNYINVFLR